MVSYIEYPVVIYKNKKSNGFFANCIIKNLMAFGKTEKDAINNITTTLNDMEKEHFIRIKPIYKMSNLRKDLLTCQY